MELYKIIENDIKICLKNKNKNRLSNLKLLKNEIIMNKINNKLSDELAFSDENIINIALKQVKSMKKALDIAYSKENEDYLNVCKEFAYYGKKEISKEELTKIILECKSNNVQNTLKNVNIFLKENNLFFEDSKYMAKLTKEVM